ncbi:MAG: DUF1385 domain-containing protein [Acidobacteria bacterium]|nr:DUF1385 domain-containing protein [Acidobacteriota bacterium]
MSANEKDLIVGGQAVIEGVMMRTPSAYAVAVRRPDGTITHTGAPLPKWSDKFPVLKLPVLRGAAVLVQSMMLGIKALNYSAAEAFVEEEETAKEKAVVLTPAVVEGEGDFAGITGGVPGLFPIPTKKRPEDELKRGSAAAFGSIALALLINVLLFVVAPLVLTNALFIAAGWATPVTSATVTTDAASVQTQQTTATVPGAQSASSANAVNESWYERGYHSARSYLRPVRPSISFNLVDGLIRMSFFLIMIFSFSLMKDIRRVFEYHGAEHKTVFTWEAGLPLTVENARPQPRQHPRCGTSFLMIVMFVSIALFSVIKFDSLVYNMLVRIALMPVVAGLSYEIIRLSAKREGSLIFKVMTLPGVWLQNITTKEPDDQQLEVAIIALKESLALEPKTETAVVSPLA